MKYYQVACPFVQYGLILATKTGRRSHQRKFPLKHVIEMSDGYGGFHKWGYPTNWTVYKGNSILKWMMTGGIPILGNPHMDAHWRILNVYLQT